MDHIELATFYFSDSPETLYYKELGEFYDPFDRINILTQSYLRVLNNLKTSQGEEDSTYTNLLRQFVAAIRSHYTVMLESGDAAQRIILGNPSLLDLIHSQEESMAATERPISAALEQYVEVGNEARFNKEISVTFQLIYGPLGPAVMYGTSMHMNSFIQVQAYLLLMKHLLGSLSLNHTQLFIYYIAAIDHLLDHGGRSYNDPDSMVRLLKDATPMMVELAISQKNPYIAEFKAYLPH